MDLLPVHLDAFRKSSYPIVFGQNIFNILHRHLLINTRSLFNVVFVTFKRLTVGLDIAVEDSEFSLHRYLWIAVQRLVRLPFYDY